MARISEAEIERIKSQISLSRLAAAKGVKLKPHGENLLGLCPFHDDREPSLVITPSKNLWHCLGACQTGGTVIDWVMRAEGVSFRYALELLRTEHFSLAADAGATSATKAVKKSTVQKLTPLTEGAHGHDDAELFESVVGYYQETLAASPEALAYLEKRGINNAEAATRFRLGFANRTLAYRLPHKNRKPGAELRGELQRLGVLRESGHEHFNGSLVIPVFDEQGRVTEMYGRKINENLREGTPRHLYLPGPHRGVWNESALAESKEIILCEALIDALTFWCAGYRNVTAAYGVEGFAEDHRAAFRKHGVERVLIAYDRDEAGDRGAEKLAKELSAEGIECRRVMFPKNMDANTYALKVQPAPQGLGLVLKKAEWMARPRRESVAVESGAVSQPASAAPQAPAASESAPAVNAAAPAVAPTPAPEPAAAKPSPAPEPSPALSVEPPAAAPAVRLSTREVFSLAAELGAAVADEDQAARGSPNPAAPRTSPASSTPPAAAGSEQHHRFGDRRWRLRFLGKPAPGTLKLNLLVLVGRPPGFAGEAAAV